MRHTIIDADAFRDFEAAGWEEKTAPYHRFFGRITGRAIERLLDAAQVGAGTSVLDIATGPGYVAGRAAGRGASVIGTDIAPAMVALARELNPGIAFRQADAEELPFGDGSFEAVVGNFVVPHLGRPERAVAECSRVLTPEGKLALSMWDAPDQNRLFGVLTEAVAEAEAPLPADIPAGPPFFRFSSDEEFSALLAAAGFEEVEVRSFSFTHRLSGAEELFPQSAATIEAGMEALGLGGGALRVRGRPASGRVARGARGPWHGGGRPGPPPPARCSGGLWCAPSRGCSR
jgi:ubiquinone/menaquinone biosynthesis C-methylase UbiE